MSGRRWWWSLALVFALAAPACSGNRNRGNRNERWTVEPSKKQKKPGKKQKKPRKVAKPAREKHERHEHSHGSHPHSEDAHHHHPHPHPHLDGPDGHHHPY